MLAAIELSTTVTAGYEVEEWRVVEEGAVVNWWMKLDVRTCNLCVG